MASTHVSLITAGGTANRRIASSLYGYCTTEAATVAKTVSLYTGNGTTADGTWAAGDLFHGLTITVRFQYANTATNPTLNVNGTGAKPMYRYGTTVSGASAALSWQAQGVVTFTYDTLLNSSGCWVQNDYNNTTYSAGTAALLTEGTNTGSRLWSAKILHDYIAGISNPAVDWVTSTGSSGNWQWRIWNSGLKEVEGKYDGTPATGKHYATVGGLYGYRVDSFSIPTAARFTTTDYKIVANWTIGSGFAMDAGTVTSRSTSGFSLYALASASNQSTVHIHFYCIGH